MWTPTTVLLPPTPMPLLLLLHPLLLRLHNYSCPCTQCSMDIAACTVILGPPPLQPPTAAALLPLLLLPYTPPSPLPPPPFATTCSDLASMLPVLLVPTPFLLHHHSCSHTSIPIDSLSVMWMPCLSRDPVWVGSCSHFDVYPALRTLRRRGDVAPLVGTGYEPFPSPETTAVMQTTHGFVGTVPVSTLLVALVTLTLSLTLMTHTLSLTPP